MKKTVLKLTSLLCAAVIAGAGTVNAYADNSSSAGRNNIPVSLSEAVKTSYKGSSGVIGKNVKLTGITASKSVINDFAKKVNATAKGKIILPADTASQTYYTINGNSDNGYFSVSLVNGQFYDFFRINDNYYPVNKVLDSVCRKLIDTDGTEDKIPDRMLKYRLQCSEPKTDKAYMTCAKALVGRWLDTLKTETGEYKLTSYSFNNETLPTENDAVRGVGLISGGREFCCTVGFDTQGTGKNSVFTIPENSGYNRFYDYYSGALVVVRCRWENGICRIVDYGRGEKYLTEGLNGIRTDSPAYDTLFDFYRDTKTVEKMDKAVVYKTTSNQTKAASSPIYMADGRIGYVAIYPRTYVKTGKDGIKTAVYDNAFFGEDRKSTYSSPVDYKDGEGAQKENFHETFSLVFDDYNGDGNADFALKQSASDETKDGARYEVRCMSNDITPRGERFSFFMAGRTEESIRLQHIDGGRYVYWSKDKNGKLTPNAEIDDYRMYSERYYLPAKLRAYDDEDKIYCFFWNNTSKDVKVGGKYHIEYNKNGNWVDVSKNRKLAETTAKAYRDTELKFNISGIKRTPGEYRIVMKVGNKTVYGGFYIGGTGSAISVSAESRTIPAGADHIEFTVKNTGTEPVRISEAYIASDGTKVTELTVGDSLVPAGEEKNFAAELGKALTAGKYTIKIPYGAKTASYAISVKNVKDSALTFFGGKCTASLTDGKLDITVKNGIYTKADASLKLSDIGSPEVYLNNQWTKTHWMLYPVTAVNAYSTAINIAYGKSRTFTFADSYNAVMENPEILAEAKELYKYYIESLDERKGTPEYEKYRDMTFDEFMKHIAYGDSEPTEPPKGSLYRLKLGSEYIYFVN
ncbi:MAG: hypothetical protein II820_10355 [Ruminiclostridium sp.]|nr:hypothetical protein [Ruminiclostridium sp.]